MMTYEQFKSYMHDLFGHFLEDYQEDDEYGYNNFSLDSYDRIGYSTNITPEIVLQAAKRNIQLIMTHHDAWDFIYGMKEECNRLLKEHKIAHFYVHLPLDYIDFGTCRSLFQQLGVDRIVQQSRPVEGDSSIGIAEFDAPISFEQLVERMAFVLEENVFFQKNNSNAIRRVGMVTGAGNGTNQLREALHNNCDAYITGEKSLYTVQYAKFINLNLIVGSHTFTEVFGVRSLARKLQERFEGIEFFQLQDEHNEVQG